MGMRTPSYHVFARDDDKVYGYFMSKWMVKYVIVDLKWWVAVKTKHQKTWKTIVFKQLKLRDQSESHSRWESLHNTQMRLQIRVIPLH